ncbi:MAG: cobalamin biosynthesis protein CobD, partial [Cyanothece sp. SIO1E1]|nr:cobalamin biosynthesis protein CobD [Cyanothece sp. SIO1E1]
MLGVGRRLKEKRQVLWFSVGMAAWLDYLIGDPQGWLHPVQVMGGLIHHYVQLALQRWQQPQSLRLAGIVLGMGLVAGSGLASWLMIQLAARLHPWAGQLLEIILLAACFAGRSLRDAAADVLKPLQSGDVAIARTHLSRYVGRDTQDLEAAAVLRAVLETVTENATDGVMAPLFYALLGATLGIGSAPLALAYKAASTLDSMVGYREAPYTHLGWFSA